MKNDPLQVQGVKSSNILANQSPMFDSINSQRRFYNFRLKDGSPAINKGMAAGVAVDLDGNTRPVGAPDLGAYERRWCVGQAIEALWKRLARIPSTKFVHFTRDSGDYSRRRNYKYAADNRNLIFQALF